MTAIASASAPEVNRSSVARSAMWSIVENGGLALISFSSLIIYSRFLSVSDFGLFSIALAVVELMTMLVGMLFHDALVQRPDVTELHYDTAFTATLGLSAALVALCFVIAPLFAQRAGNPAAAPVLMWISLCLPLTALGATIVARQRRNLAFRTLALRSLIGRSVGAAVGIVLVVSGAAFWGLVAQQVLIVLFGSLVLWITCRERPKLRFGVQEFRQLIGFGSVAVASLFVNFSMKRSFIVLCGIMLGTSAAGLLNMCFRVIDTFWSLASSAISQIALPTLSSLSKDDKRFGRAFHTASAFICVVLYFCFVLIGATSAEVVELLFGRQWLAITPYVTILSLQVLIQARRMVFNPVMTSRGRPRDLLVCQVAELSFTLVAIALSGVPSVSWAIGIWVARECLGVSIQVWLLRRAINIGIRDVFSGSVVPLLCAIAMYGAVWAARDALPAGWVPAARLALLAPLGALVYFGCVFLLERRLLVDLLGFVRSALQRKSAGTGLEDNKS